METLPMALELIEPHCFMLSVDFKDAYYSVPVHHDFRKYLRFVFGILLYTCLPDGLACARRVFTKLLKYFFSHLRAKGLHFTLLFGWYFADWSRPS